MRVRVRVKVWVRARVRVRVRVRGYLEKSALNLGVVNSGQH